MAARSAHGRDRDGPGERARRSPAAPTATTRCSASTVGTGRADRPGARGRGPIDHRRPRRLGDDGRRARGDRGAAQPGPAALGRTSGWPATCAPASSTPPPCSPRRRGPRPAQVGLLTARLEQLARRYAAEHGVDVTELDGAGAAGGLAGGLAALGARLVGGFDLVAEHVELDERVSARRRRRHRRGLPRRPEPRRQGRRRRLRPRRRQRPARRRHRR